MTILITGATGFLGGRLARQLKATGARIRVLARPGSHRAHLQDLALDYVEGDLRDPAALARSLDGCTLLYHVAADYRLWARQWQSLYDSNVTGTVNLMQAALAAGVRRIVYTSSVATLGNRGDGEPADEDTPVTIDEMIGHYKRSKFIAEQEVARLIRERGLPAVIVNPTTPVGPGDVRPTPTGRMIRDAAAGRIPAYVDTGLNIVHVDDVARGHLMACERGAVGRRYVLGGDNLALKDILRLICETAGRPAPQVRLPRAIVYPVAVLSEAWARLSKGPEPQATVDGLRMSRKKMYFSSARAVAELGYAARPAEEALREATRWFMERSG
jgi:dihydroflavonol-4-reductase